MVEPLLPANPCAGSWQLAQLVPRGSDSALSKKILRPNATRRSLTGGASSEDASVPISGMEAGGIESGFGRAGAAERAEANRRPTKAIAMARRAAPKRGAVLFVRARGWLTRSSVQIVLPQAWSKAR